MPRKERAVPPGRKKRRTRAALQKSRALGGGGRGARCRRGISALAGQAGEEQTLAAFFRIVCRCLCLRSWHAQSRHHVIAFGHTSSVNSHLYRLLYRNTSEIYPPIITSPPRGVTGPIHRSLRVFPVVSVSQYCPSTLLTCPGEVQGQ